MFRINRLNQSRSVAHASRTLAVGVLALTAFVAFSAQAIDLRASAVFLMTNQVDNAVIAYHRTRRRDA